MQSAAATRRPILHKGVWVELERCTDCRNHAHCTKHVEEKYEFYERKVRAAIESKCAVEVNPGPKAAGVRFRQVRYNPHLFQANFQFCEEGMGSSSSSKTTRYPRLGAFEVYVCRGKAREEVYSKLATSKWPNIEALVSRVEEVAEELGGGEAFQTTAAEKNPEAGSPERSAPSSPPAPPSPLRSFGEVTYRMSDPEGDAGDFTGAVNSRGRAHGRGILRYDVGHTFIGSFLNGALDEGTVYDVSGKVNCTMKSGRWTRDIDDELVRRFPFSLAQATSCSCGSSYAPNAAFCATCGMKREEDGPSLHTPDHVLEERRGRCHAPAETSRPEALHVTTDGGIGKPANNFGADFGGSSAPTSTTASSRDLGVQSASSLPMSSSSSSRPASAGQLFLTGSLATPSPEPAITPIPEARMQVAASENTNAATPLNDETRLNGASKELPQTIESSVDTQEADLTAIVDTAEAATPKADESLAAARDALEDATAASPAQPTMQPANPETVRPPCLEDGGGSDTFSAFEGSPTGDGVGRAQNSVLRSEKEVSEVRQAPLAPVSPPPRPATACSDSFSAFEETLDTTSPQGMAVGKLETCASDQASTNGQAAAAAASPAKSSATLDSPNKVDHLQRPETAANDSYSGFEDTFEAVSPDGTGVGASLLRIEEAGPDAQKLEVSQQGYGSSGSPQKSAASRVERSPSSPSSVGSDPDAKPESLKSASEDEK